MISGLVSLLINPAAWLAVGVALLTGFSGGVFKGWADSKAENLQKTIVVLREASQRKDQLIRQNADRYLEDQQEATRLQEKLNEILSSADTASACKPSDAELDSLRKL
jgi:hypothetical protein